MLVMQYAIMATNAPHGHGDGCECLMNNDARLPCYGIAQLLLAAAGGALASIFANACPQGTVGGRNSSPTLRGSRWCTGVLLSWCDELLI